MASHTIDTDYRSIIVLAIPVMISQLSQTVMAMTDIVMVARISTVALAAVGLGSIGMHVVHALAYGINGAWTTLSAQATGTGDYGRLACLARQILPAALLALICYSAVYISLPFWIPWLGQTPDVTHDVLTYTQIRLLGGVPVVMMHAMLGHLQGMGDTKTAMRVGLISNVLNIIFDYIAIFGLGPIPGFGVAGAAVASVCANVVGCALTYWWFRPQLKYCRDQPPKIERIRAVRRELWEVGYPASLNIALSIASFFVISVMTGWISTPALAANQIIMQCDQLVFMPMFGLSQAIQILIGQHVGAKNWDQVHRAATRGLILGISIESIGGIAVALGGGFIVALVSSDPSVTTIARHTLWLAPLWMLADAWAMTYYGALKGWGETKFPLVTSVIVGWGISLPLAYLLGITLGYGLFGIWIAMTVRMTLGGALYHWKFSKMYREVS